jgi:hypothetical protein
MSKKETVSNTRLAEIDAGLARVNEAWSAWDAQLVQEQRRLEERGMDMWEALDVIHQRQMEGLRSGTGPVTFSEIHGLLDELFDLYLRADEDQRLLIRGLFEDKNRLLKYLYSYVGGRAAPHLGSTGDVEWLRRGLAAASIDDQRVDWRDLLICLGALWMAAEEAGIAPARFFSSVARISNDEPRYGSSSTRALLRGFRNSGHLRSIKRKVGESGR